MAKNSNKKSKRRKSKEAFNRKQEARARFNQVDPYQATLLADKRATKEYYGHIMTALDNPNSYKYHLSDNSTVPRAAVNLAQAVHEANLSPQDRKTVKRLVEVGKRSKIIEKEGDGNGEYLLAFVRLVQYKWLWLRNPDQWKPVTKNREKQFSSLARYLLTKYDVPRFLDYAWLGDGLAEKNYREWFINLGMGENIRKQRGLPIPFTKKMAHLFSQAPSNLTVKGACRWAQVLSMGGDHRIVMGLMTTPLGESFANDDFWVSVIRMFIASPFLDTNQYRSIYDYIREKKFVSRGRRWIDGRLVDLGPEQPGFSMKGRHPQALMEQVARWHRDLAKSPYGVQDYSWDTCGIEGFRLVEGKKEAETIYNIVELLSSRDLRDEGNAMHHCVSSYARSCNEGRIAIYSMVRTDPEPNKKTTRQITIELDVANKLITQVRRKFNEAPTNKDFKVLDLWARENGLSISTWVRR